MASWNDLDSVTPSGCPIRYVAPLLSSIIKNTYQAHYISGGSNR